MDTDEPCPEDFLDWLRRSNLLLRRARRVARSIDERVRGALAPEQAGRPAVPATDRWPVHSGRHTRSSTLARRAEERMEVPIPAQFLPSGSPACIER